MTPATVERFAAGREVQPADVLALAQEHGVRMVDFKFTDLPGTWQHIGLSIHALDEDAFAGLEPGTCLNPGRVAGRQCSRRAAAGREDRGAHGPGGLHAAGGPGVTGPPPQPAASAATDSQAATRAAVTTHPGTLRRTGCPAAVRACTRAISRGQKAVIPPSRPGRP